VVWNPCVVIPSIRNVDPTYLEPLRDTPVAVVDDTGGALKAQRPWHTILTDDFRRELPRDVRVDLVPTRSPSCKGLGLWWAWREGFDPVILLDDDCDARISPRFLEEIPVGRVVPTLGFRSPSGWLNTLRLLGETRFWPRGFPYEWRHEEPQLDEAPEPRLVAFNEGLWAGTPDINGMDKLALPDAPATDPRRRLALPHPVRLTRGQHLPLSIMNVQLARDLLPAFYQPPDYDLQGGFRIRRHDDVWSCYALTALMHRRGDVATAGGPLVHHRKEGDALKEALSEHCTNLIQPYVCQAIDVAAERLVPGTYAEMAIALGGALAQDATNFVPGQWARVVGDYGLRLARWARLFEREG
jgi:hypothetical protein